jgi:ketosteroid isomerase-like protein
MDISILIDLDNAFCEAVSRLGAEEWADHFSGDGIMLTKMGKNIVTSEEIYKVMEPFFEIEGNSLRWFPENGGISDDGTLGYTYGKYVRVLVNESEEKVEEGRYMTIWRKVDDVNYKIEVDMGN